MTTYDMAPPPIASDALRIISENYLLEKFRNHSELKNSQSDDKTGEIDMIQVLFDNSIELLKMYGSPEEFVDNLKIYRNFTTSYKYFETKHANLHYTIPIVYTSLTGEVFMAKADFYVILENIALRNLHPKPNSNFHEVGVYCAFLTNFLKIKAKSVNRKIEFVRFNEKEIDDIENEFVKGIDLSDGPSSTDISFHGRKSPGGTIKHFSMKMREYLPGVADDDGLFQCLQSANCSFDKEERPLRLSQLLYEMETMRSCLNGIINKRQHLFHRKSTEIQPSAPIVVRMFEDGYRQFVMNGEFLKAIGLDVNYSPKVVYGVIEMKEVSEKYKDHVDQIEFIRTPILRSKHKAVPIRLMDSLEFCVLAVDGLFEVLKEHIFGLKLFLHVEEWSIAVLKQILMVFDSKVNNPYFVNLSLLNNLKKSINENSPTTSSPLSEIRDVKQPGFTIRNLRRELKFLGLEKHFPEITDHAEMVYKEVMKCQKESNLRTCDMFDAVEKCQIRCIFDRVPELKTFLHNQKSCSRVVGLKCDSCYGAVPESSETIEISATTESLNALEISKSSKSNKKNEKSENKLKEKKKNIGISETTESINKLNISKSDKLKEKDEEAEKLKSDALTRKSMKAKYREKIADLEKELSELKKQRVEDRGKELEKLKEENLIEVSKKAATIDKLGNENGQLKAEIARYKANEATLMEAKFHAVTTINRLEEENKTLKSSNEKKEEIKKMKSDALTQQKTMKKNKNTVALEKEVAELTKEKLQPSTRCSTALLKLEISRQAATIQKMGREKGQLKAEIARYKTNKTTLMETKSHAVTTINRLEKENKTLKSSNDNCIELMTNAVAREEAKFEEMHEKFSKKIAELEQELQRNRQQAPPTPTPSSSTVATSSHRQNDKCWNCRTFLDHSAPMMECQQCRRRFHPECVECWGMNDVCSYCLGKVLIVE